MPETDPLPAHMRPTKIACPTCGAAAGKLCTSHSGRRVRPNNVHQLRTKAWEQLTKQAARRHRCPVKPVETPAGLRHRAQCHDCDWTSADHVVRAGAEDEARIHRARTAPTATT